MRSRPRGATFTARLLWPELFVLLLLSQINTTLVAWNKGGPQFWRSLLWTGLPDPKWAVSETALLIAGFSSSSRLLCLLEASCIPGAPGLSVVASSDLPSSALLLLSSVVTRSCDFSDCLQTVLDFIFKTSRVVNLILPAAFIISCHGAYAFLDSEDWGWNRGRSYFLLSHWNMFFS